MAPPTASRFVEGSMNDRASAVPPPQFLGADQADQYEAQFYYGAGTAGTAAHQQFAESPRPIKKATGFFGRVRDAFLGGLKGSGSGNVGAGVGNRQQQEDPAVEKRGAPMPITAATTTTAAAPQHRPAQPIPIMKSHAKQQVPLAASSASMAGGMGGDRPSREEVMQSYSHLIATGFFQTHAIKSTRQPPPGSMSQSAATVPAPPMPTSPARPHPPTRAPPPPPDNTALQASPKMSTPTILHSASANVAYGYTAARTVATPSTRGGDLHAAQSRESLRHQFRGRKRGRADTDDNISDTASLTTAGLGRRLVKRLRRSPGPDAPPSTPGLDTPRWERGSVALRKAEGLVRLVPSLSTASLRKAATEWAGAGAGAGSNSKHRAGADAEPLAGPTPLHSPSPVGATATPTMSGGANRGVRISRSITGNKLRKRQGPPSWNMTAATTGISSVPGGRDNDMAVDSEQARSTAVPFADQALAGVAGRGADGDEGPTGASPMMELSTLPKMPDANRAVPATHGRPGDLVRERVRNSGVSEQDSSHAADAMDLD